MIDPPNIIFQFGKWLLPIWAMMIVFKPDSFQGSKPTTNGNDIDEQPPIVQRASVHVSVSFTSWNLLDIKHLFTASTSISATSSPIPPPPPFNEKIGSFFFAPFYSASNIAKSVQSQHNDTRPTPLN